MAATEERAAESGVALKNAGDSIDERGLIHVDG